MGRAHRLEHAVAAFVLLAAFVGDLRILVAVTALALTARVRFRPDDRLASAIDATLLGVAVLSFGLGNEVLAWTLALVVAVLAGLGAARPSLRVNAPAS